MKENYEIEFNKEIDRILTELYNNPLQNIPHEKRALIKTEKRYVDYLISYDLVSKVKVDIGSTEFPLSLNKNGYEVFEKYNGWDDYKKQVIDKNAKFEQSKKLAQKYWWLPIAISLLAIILSGLTLYKQILK